MQRHREGAEADLREAYRQRSEQALHYIETELGPRATALWTTQRYQQALVQLGRPLQEWVAEAQVALQGVDAAELIGQIEALVGPKLEEYRRAARAHWESRDRELEGLLRARAEQLQVAIAANPEQDPAPLLQAYRTEQLEASGPALDQIPPGWERRFLRAERELSEDLRVARLQVWERAARSGLARDWEQAQASYSDRRYAELASRWAEGLASAWRSAIHDQLRMLRDEAELLEGLVESAARGVRASHATEKGVFYRSIRRSGRLVVDPDPLGMGFGLRVAKRGSEPEVLRFVLRDTGKAGATVLEATDVEMFAARDPLPIDADERELQLALFRYHEGGDLADLEATVNAKRESSVRPSDDRGALWTMLAERLRRRRKDAGEVDRQRRENLDREMIALNLDRSDPRFSTDRIRARVEAIRKSSGDLLSPEQASDLARILDEEPRDAVPSLAEAFPSARIMQGTVLGASQAVELLWDFDQGSAGAWKTGPFQIVAGSLSLLEGLSGWEQLVAPQGAAVLGLGRPLDLRGKLRVTIVFQKPTLARPRNELVFSLAGYHLILLDDADAPRFLGGTESREVLWKRAQEGDLGSFGGFSPLANGVPHTLVVELDLVGGELREVKLGASELRYPRSYLAASSRKALGAPTLELRSLQEIEVQSITVETDSKR